MDGQGEEEEGVGGGGGVKRRSDIKKAYTNRWTERGRESESERER